MPDTPTTILLVEDEAIIALARTRRLEELGYRVTHALGYRAALRAFEPGREPIDLVLMDIDLGADGPDGVETAREILAGRDVPVVFVSSHNEPEVLERTEKATSYGYIEKDSKPMVYRTAIKMALRLHEANRRTKTSEARYRALAELSPDMIYLVDRDMRVEFVNERGAAMFRKPAAEVAGRRLDELFPPTLAARHAAAIRRVIETGTPLTSELEERFPTGPVWIDARLAPVTDADGRVRAVIGVSTDITERKRRERALEEVERRFRSAIDTIDEAYYLHDLDCRVYDTNLAAVRMTGYSREEILAGGLRLLNPDLSDDLVRIRRSAIAADGAIRFPSRHVRKDGAALPVEVYGTTIAAEGRDLVQSFVRPLPDAK
jgi:PAS domain S-box-containing protein